MCVCIYKDLLAVVIVNTSNKNENFSLERMSIGINGGCPNCIKQIIENCGGKIQFSNCYVAKKFIVVEI